VLQLTARVSGDKQVTATLRELVKRTGPPGRGRLLAAIGQRVALRHMPDTIRKNRPGWPKPDGRFRAWRAGESPLVDTGRLSGSWAWRANQRDVRIWTAVRYARQLDRGGEIRPRGRFLLIPLSPPLTKSEARAWPTGRAAIAARFPGSFFLFGPEGPGIYRKSRRRTGSNVRSRTARYQGRTRSIERIAAARRSVNQRGYHFGHWRREWMPDLIAVAQEFIVTGRGPSAPSSGGNPDKGGRS
jgi:hypothetical protein